jgi:signal-transduction protein with cAMP-binding, CBS, and nucleotidyltransferase domain
MNDIIYLSDKEIDTFGKFFSPCQYTSNAQALYQSHVPHVGFILVSGTLCIQKKKEQINLKRGAVIGIKELFHQTPVNFKLLVETGTTVYAISRSSMLSLLSHREDTNTTEEQNKIIELLDKAVS